MNQQDQYIRTSQSPQHSSNTNTGYTTSESPKYFYRKSGKDYCDWLLLVRKSGLLKRLGRSMAARLVLIELACCAGRDFDSQKFGLCWPKQETIAESVGITVKSVWAGLKVLQELDIVTVTSQHKKDYYKLANPAVLERLAKGFSPEDASTESPEDTSTDHRKILPLRPEDTSTSHRKMLPLTEEVEVEPEVEPEDRRERIPQGGGEEKVKVNSDPDRPPSRFGEVCPRPGVMIPKDRYHEDMLANANGNFPILYRLAIEDMNLRIPELGPGESKQAAYDRLVNQVDLLNGGGR